MMKTMKKILLCLLCLAMLVPMIAACAGDVIPTEETTAAEGGNGGAGNGGLPNADVPDATVEGKYGLFFDGAFVISELDAKGRFVTMWELNDYLMIEPIPMCEFTYDESGRLIYANIEQDEIYFFHEADRVLCQYDGEEGEARITYHKNGSLKSVLVYEYDNVWEGYEFDTQGRMVRGGEFDGDGNLLEGLSATYEKKKIELNTLYEGEISDESMVVQFNDRGTPIAYGEAEGGVLCEEDTRYYTWENGRLVSLRSMNTWWVVPEEGSGEEGWSETVEEIVTLTYDKNGRCILAEHTENGEPTETASFTYDENGYRIFDYLESGAYQYFYENGRVVEYVRYHKQSSDGLAWQANRFDPRTGATLADEFWIGGNGDYSVKVDEYSRDVPEGAPYAKISKCYTATATTLGGELTRVSNDYTLSYLNRYGGLVNEETGAELQRGASDQYGNFLNTQGEIIYYQKYMDDSGNIFYYTADGVVTPVA